MNATESADDGALLREARELTPALYALGRVLRLRGVDEAGLAPLAPSDLEVLRHVLDAPGVGVGTVARDLALHASNVSVTVRGLVAHGLIRRERDPQDRRAVQLYPTMGAMQGMAAIEQAWSEIFADSLATLSEDERASLRAAVPALRSLAASLRAQRSSARG
ncbi:MarR family transcriptional regulator [Streptomyces sp. NBC_01142]|uniref:MarR family winged helix-turn-helix transcriptional regulator n=1 Tax=Streptomyces sp. NBC_01142 TaxID=2975865 RepID=UPI00224F483E|nr:MarR family transcriptional regulator [Streptomyces sp. NBC_01142]MCX4824978.1 MarR family transcriptional regulator [Streptomyces sp. NBC_01142]